MEFRAVGNRCAVVIDDLHLPISGEETVALLRRKGFGVIEVDIIGLARACIGHSRYRRRALLSDAPVFVDCSGFMKWLYAHRGIWLPRLAVQQCECGEWVHVRDVRAGDLVFVSGRFDFYRHDFINGVGHVGMATGEGTVVHASYETGGVVEVPFGLDESWVDRKKLRGVRRYLPKGKEVLTLEIPSGREIETADDIRWLVLQSLKKRRW